ncbi:hypothetical protein D3C87_1090760 [compost metagenome]
MGVDAADFVAVGQRRQQVEEFQTRDVLIDQQFQINVSIEGGAVWSVATLSQQTGHATQHELQVFCIAMFVAQLCHLGGDTAGAFHTQLIAFVQSEVVDGVRDLLKAQIPAQTFKVVWLGNVGEEDAVVSSLRSMHDEFLS